MKTMIVTFIRDAEDHELGPDDPRYRAGDTATLRLDKALRWVKRNKAVEAEVPAPEPVEARPLDDGGDEEPERAEDETPELREEYQRVIGRRPYMGWDAETLREKIALALG